ncbi:MAG: phage holin family protein [Pseudomonadota bacterium]
MPQHADIKDTPSMLITAFRQLAQLMQDEVALARAEISRNLSRAGTGLALIGVAAILALTALDVLAGALVAYLATTDLSVGTAALIVGGGCLAVALGLAVVGRSRLTADALSPDRTMRNMSRDLDTMKEATDA